VHRTLSAFAGAEAKGHDGVQPGCAQRLFVVHWDGMYRGYLNCCPHRCFPLNWLPDRFLDPGVIHIQFASHGALFTIAERYCVRDRAWTSHLLPVRLATRGAELWLDEPATAAG
jgi:nitrite reductase/ring-hydroxylating ferredoxin subunit